MKLLLSLILTANAGLLTRLCSKLIMPDPYVYETVEIEWLVSHLDLLCVRKRWRALSDDDALDFKIITYELQRRASFGPDRERDMADEALIRCAQ